MNDVTIQAKDGDGKPLGEPVKTTSEGLKQAAAAVQLPGGGADKLRSLVDRIERLEEEKQTLAADIADVKKEAKEAGFCTKTISAVVKRRMKDQQELFAEDQMLDTYLHALGMSRG